MALTTKQAMEIVEKLFGDDKKFWTLQVEICRHTNMSSPEIIFHGYVNGFGWTEEYPDWDGVIAELKGKLSGGEPASDKSLILVDEILPQKKSEKSA